MTTVQSKISATNHFLTVDTIAKVKGHSVAHAGRAFRLVKQLAGINGNHSIHVDIFVIHAQSIPYFFGLKREDFLRIN